MPYIHFTEAQKLQANAVDLVEFLRFKGEPLIREGSEYRLGSNHSVTVRDNEWYDHAAEKGGGPVTFLKEFYGMNYAEAVLALIDKDVSELCPQVAAPREKVKKPFELPPANDTNRRVFAYLLKHRHLDRDVLTTFVRQGLVYEDQKYHNAVFVGMDKDGTPRHAHKRSPNSQGKTFRMTAEGSDFRFAFNWPGSNNHLLVFEVPMICCPSFPNSMTAPGQSTAMWRCAARPPSPCWGCWSGAHKSTPSTLRWTTTRRGSWPRGGWRSWPGRKDWQ